MQATGWTHKGSKSTNETLSIEIDVAAKTLTIDGDTWPLTGDTFRHRDHIGWLEG